MVEYKGKEVILMACSSCNIKRCEHCYISYEGDRKPEELKKLASTLVDNYEVYINGAEVLVNKEYFDSYKIINQNWMLTNGFEIYRNPDILDFLKDRGIEIVEMSYHFGIQDKISKINNAMLEKNIGYLKAKGMKFKLLVTINTENYNMIDQMCEKAIELGAYGIEFTNFLNQGNARNMDLSNLLSLNQINEFFEQLLKVRKKYPKDKLVIDRSGLFGKNRNSSSCHFNCPAGRDMVVITPDNNVYSCLFLAKPGLEIGKYINGKILLNNEIDNDGELCLAQELCNKNNNKVLSKVLKIGK